MAVIWGIPYLLIKIVVGELTPASLVLLRTAIGAALLLPPRTLPSGRVLVALLILGVACTALAFLLFFALIGEVGPVRATVITYFNPAVALVLGVALLHEPFTVGAIVGFGQILVGSVLATRRSSALAGAGVRPSSSPWASATRYTRERLRRFQGSGR
jgi:drug/metabolite transporter (DMT)-like permease